MLLVSYTDGALADVHPLMGAAGQCHVASLRKFLAQVNILNFDGFEISSPNKNTNPTRNLHINSDKTLAPRSYPNSHASLRPDTWQRRPVVSMVRLFGLDTLGPPTGTCPFSNVAPQAFRSNHNDVLNPKQSETT